MFVSPLEKPVIWSVSTILVWVVIYGSLEMVLFDGDLASAAIQGLAGGIAFSLFYLYITDDETPNDGP